MTGALASSPGAIAGTAGSASDTSRLQNKDNLEAAGQRFEAIFTKMMLSSMRKAKLGDGLFESKALDQFRDMQDDQLAKSMSVNTPMGIGKAMTAFLARGVGSSDAAAPAGNSESTGG